MKYNKVSAQRIFDKVTLHLIVQGEKARKGVFRVLYDKETGNKCAYGCLLSIKELKKPQWVDSVVGMNKYLGLRGNKADLMGELMGCHDNVKPSRWPQRLRAIARSFQLEIPDFLKDK